METCENNKVNNERLDKDFSSDTEYLDDTKTEQTKEESESSVNKEAKCDKIYTSVGKIDMNVTCRRKVTILAHQLKRLSHEGSMDKFNAIVTRINDRYKSKKPKLGMCVQSFMGVYDIKFTVLDAQIEARRLKYDTNLTDSDMFDQMENIIKFTSNPTSSSMTYLARLGSALSMKTTLENGLAYLQFAKQHSIQISPCKDTGMVFYINANLLSQKLELNPSAEMKKELLETIEHAMAHFEKEIDDVRNDYSRMLMLKKAYCYLGLNLFGKKIQEISVSEDDRKSAKNCLDFIEKPDIWKRMESRRKMLYHIAKAEYYRQGQLFESSLMHAKIAFMFAQENSWTAELPNIIDLINDVESASQKAAGDDDTDDKLIEQLLSTGI